MENPMVSNIRKRSSKSRSRSNTPVQKYFLSSSDEVLPDVPAMNTRSSSRQCFVVLEDSVYQKYKTSDYSSEDGDNSIQTDSRSEHIDNRRNGQREQHQKDLLAYKEYHEAGQYWNKFPKTDYTYSKRSPHRRELPDGSVALPNMSRPSLHTFDERMHKKNLAERVTYFERCTKKDYSQLTDESTNVYSTSAPSSSHYRTSEHYVSSRNYNGKDITDVTVVEEEDNGLLSKLWMRVSSAGRWTKSWFVNVEEAETKKYRTPLRHEMNENRGYATRAYGAITSAALRLMTWVYWLIGSVLILDCKLLSGRETPPRSRTRPLVLLVLLPLLLLCGLHLCLSYDFPDTASLDKYYPLEHPVSYYPSLVYDGVFDTVEYSKAAAQNGAEELKQYWYKVKEYSEDAIGSLDVSKLWS